MKKLFILIAGLISIQSYSQITLTESDFPVPDEQYIISHAVDMGSLNYTTAGASVTWDFSSLVPNRQDTILFESTISSNIPVTYIAAFNNPLDPDHKATVCAGQDYESPMPTLTFTDVYNFYKLTSSAYIQVGMGATINGAPLPIQWDPTDRILPLPAEYGDMDTSNSAFSASIPTLGYYSEERVRYNHIDAYGTLITPFGTFDALRVVSYLEIHDSLYYDAMGMGFPIDRTETEYKWFAQGYLVPVMLITERGGMGAGITISYVDSLRNLSVDEKHLNTMRVYPVPADEFIMFDAPGLRFPALAVVFDVNGRELMREEIESPELNVSSLQAGCYRIQLIHSGLVYQASFLKP